MRTRTMTNTLRCIMKNLSSNIEIKIAEIAVVESAMGMYLCFSFSFFIFPLIREYALILSRSLSVII